MNEFILDQWVHLPAPLSNSQYGQGTGGRVVEINGDLVWVRVWYHNGAGFCEDTIQYMASELSTSPAAALGRKGGSATSEAKTEANRAKANNPPGPGKRARGRPRKQAEE